MKEIDVKIEMLEILKKGPKDLEYGICGMVNGRPYADPILRRLFVKWPKFSGDIIFPVPSSVKGMDPIDCFYGKHLWDKKSPYGRNRWELLAFLIEQLELEVGTAS